MKPHEVVIQLESGSRVGSPAARLSLFSNQSSRKLWKVSPSFTLLSWIQECCFAFPVESLTSSRTTLKSHLRAVKLKRAGGNNGNQNQNLS